MKTKAILIFCMLCSVTSVAFSQSEASPIRAKRFVYMGPDKKNQKIIGRYNNCHFRIDLSFYAMKHGNGAKDFTAIFGVRSNSMMSNDDIEISVLKKWVDNPLYDDKEDRVYFVQIKNKTDQTIYIDRKYCFRLDSDGSKRYYYDPEKESDSLSVSRMIVIPPHGMSNLTDYRWRIHQNGQYAEIIEYPEDFLWNINAVGITEGYLGYGETKRFSEENSPYYRSILIAYSKQEDFSTYSLAMVNFYIREIVGMYFPETYSNGRLYESQLIGDNDYSITSWIPLY